MLKRPPESYNLPGKHTRLLIWLFVLFVILLVWIVPSQRLQEDRQEIVAAAVRENQNRAALLEQYVARTLEAADIATLHLAERYRTGDPSLRGTAADPATIRGPITGNQSFLGLSIADRDGDLVASTMGARIAGRNVRDHEAFQVHLRGDDDRLYVSRPARSSRLGGEVIWLTRRIEDRQGDFAGVVAINIAPEQLIGFHESVAIRPDDVVSVIGLDGVTRARRTGDVFTSGEDLTGGLVMRRQREDPNGTYLGPSALDGMVRYFSHRRLDDYPLFATYGVLESDVLESVDRRRRLFVGGAALVTLVTLTFALALMALLRRGERWSAEVAEANARLQEAQRIGQIGDWEYALGSGDVSWSPPLFEMYERDPSAGAPTPDEFRAMLDEESRAALNGALARAVASGDPQSYELRVRLPSGKEAHRLVSAIPVCDSQGKIVGLHGTDQDISARHRLDQLQSEVSHLSRLAAMNTMAATLAHELNQPLAAASNYLVGCRRLIESDGERAKQATEGLEAAQEQVQFAGEIIRRTRAMVSDEPRQEARVSVSRILDDALSLGIPVAERSRLRITKRIADDARDIYADGVQIQQVLLNLLRNACEAVENVADPHVRIDVSRADEGHVLVSVADNGAGIRELNAPLFTAFASDKPTGLGLGLSISRTIIESHGGRIWAENLPGSGARFSFTVPSRKSDAA